MKTKVVEDADVVTYVVVCDPGEEAVAALAQFARAERLEAAQVTAIGAQPDRQVGEIAVPEQVIVSMAEIAESTKEGLLALAVGTGCRWWPPCSPRTPAGCAGRRAGTTRPGRGTGMAARPGRSLWAGGGCR
jgi:hypothetical protein